MDPKTQRFCAGCGPALMLVFFIGFWPLAGFMPPHSPDDSPEEIRQMYVDDKNSIRIGLLMGMFAICFLVPWAGLLSTMLKRIEGRHTPLTYAQLGISVIAPIVFILPMMFWLVCTYRPETRDLEITHTLHEMGWLFFVIVGFSGPPWMVVVALAILRDRSEQPVLPRWVAYYSIWELFLLLPGCVAIFTKDGPFAYDGLLAFWMPLVTFGIWVAVLSLAMLRAIAGQERAEAAQQDRQSDPLGGQEGLSGSHKDPIGETT